MSPAILDNSEGGAYDGSDTKDSEDEVLEDLTDHVADRASFSHVSLVCAEPLNKSKYVYDRIGELRYSVRLTKNDFYEFIIINLNLRLDSARDIVRGSVNARL